jgi:hypothetical protein
MVVLRPSLTDPKRNHKQRDSIPAKLRFTAGRRQVGGRARSAGRHALFEIIEVRYI